MHKNVFKSILCLLTAIVMLITMAACGQASAPKTDQKSSTASVASTTSEQTKKEPVKLTLSAANSLNNEQLKEMIRQYGLKTGNAIELELYPDDQSDNMIKTKLATGETTDLIAWYSARGLTVKSAMETLDGPWVSKLDPGMLEKSYTDKDGRVCCAPYYPLSNTDLLYNKEVFKKAGVNPGFANYNELVAACEAIKKIGITPIYMPNKEFWTAQIVFICGAQGIFEKDPTIATRIMENKLKMSEVPEIVDSFKRQLELKDKYMNKDLQSGTYVMAKEALAKGKCGMTFLTESAFNDIQKDYPDEAKNIGMCPFSLTDDFSAAVFASSAFSLYVPKASKHKEEAKEAINIMVSDDVLIAASQNYPGISPYKGVATKMSQVNLEMIEWAKKFPVRSAVQEEYFLGFDLAQYYITYQFIYSGKDIVKALDENYNDYAKINKAKGTPGF